MVTAQWTPKSLWNIPCFYAFCTSSAQCCFSIWQYWERTALKAALALQPKWINTFLHWSTLGLTHRKFICILNKYIEHLCWFYNKSVAGSQQSTSTIRLKTTDYWLILESALEKNILKKWCQRISDAGYRHVNANVS